MKAKKKRPSEKTRITKSEAESLLRSAGMQVSEYARYVDMRGMIRFVKRSVGELSVTFHGWREVSRQEADQIQHANAELKRKYMKPKLRKYF